MNVLTRISPKTVVRIINQCERQGVPYKVGPTGSAVLVGTPRMAQVTYLPFNGHFFGYYINSAKKRVAFDSRQARFDSTRWKQQLRAFFHTEITE